jgi:hypothetical protein
VNWRCQDKKIIGIAPLLVPARSGRARFHRFRKSFILVRGFLPFSLAVLLYKYYPLILLDSFLN